MPLLSQVPEHLLGPILADAAIARHAPGDTLFHQWELPRFLHVVLEGEIGLFGATRDGDETVVEILKGGETFIIAAVLMNRHYLMSARALSPSRILVLPADCLRRHIHGTPDLAMAMLSSLSTNFRTLVREVKVLKLKSTTERLALYLMSLTGKSEGPAVLWLPHSKSVIAVRIGIRLETLSRAFAALRPFGVHVEGACVTIDDVAVLAKFCSQDEEVI